MFSEANGAGTELSPAVLGAVPWAGKVVIFQPELSVVSNLPKARGKGGRGSPPMSEGRSTADGRRGCAGGRSRGAGVEIPLSDEGLERTYPDINAAAIRLNDLIIMGFG